MQSILRALTAFFHYADYLQDTFSQSWRYRNNIRSTLVIILTLLLGWFFYGALIAPPSTFPLNKLVTIPDKTAAGDIAQVLYQSHVIQSPLMFRIMVKLTHHDYDLHAGDYIFKTPLTVLQVARVIGVGAYGLEPIKIRIPEGATTAQMAKLYSENLARFNATNFMVESQQMEGFYFPDTYFFLPNATEDTVIQAMRQNFETHEAKIDSLVMASNHSLRDIVIMASLIEREADNPSDRRMISGVLWNRIALGMPLQVDVSFLYTLGKGTFQLTKKDLSTPSDYNSYLNKGLPPTAIGSPSMDSLLAAVTPTKTKALFFLADRNGITHFCPTYECQQTNKIIYFTKHALEIATSSVSQ